MQQSAPQTATKVPTRQEQAPSAGPAGNGQAAVPAAAKGSAPVSDAAAPSTTSNANGTITADTFYGRVVATDGTDNGILLTQPKTRAYTIGMSGDKSSIAMARADRLYTIILDGEAGNAWVRNTFTSTTVGATRVAANIIDVDGPNNHIKFAHSTTRYYTIGINGDRSSMDFANRDGYYTITIDGQSGDIRLLNADVAEDFDVADDVEPGSVVVLDDDGRLRPARDAYDRRVAGVISGADGYKPAMVLDRQPDSSGRAPLALMGKVFCKVDATHGPIAAGDLLTTSTTPGHAMAVGDIARSAGAVLGKALRSLTAGQGLIPVLVSQR